jgi:hypothetical protein
MASPRPALAGAPDDLGIANLYLSCQYLQRYARTSLLYANIGTALSALFLIREELL